MRDAFLSLADLFPPERFGGSERVILELTRALAAAGCAAGILAGGREACEPDPAATVPVWRYRTRVSPIPSLFIGSYLAMRGMKRLPVVGDGGVLMLHHPLSGWGALRARHGRTARPVAFFYGPIDEEWAWHWRNVRRLGMRGLVSPMLLGVMPRFLWWVQRSVLSQADRIVVLGGYTHALVRERLPGGPPIHVVPPGVDLARFYPARSKEEAKRAVGLAPNEAVVLSVRRLVPRMGLSMLLEALWVLRRSRGAVRLVLVGTGEMAPRLMREAAALGIADSLTLTGQVSDEELAGFYRAADLFALPSMALEGFGLVTLEALASGVPVVGTAVGETPLLIGSDRALGRVVPPRDAQAMASAFEEVLESDPRAEACRAFATRFTWRAMADALRSLMQVMG